MKSGDRLLSTLWLFSAERPILTADEIAVGLTVSLSTAYRYVAQLCEAGMLAPMGSVGYGLGPAIIELDRQIRQSDPLVQSAAPVLRRLLDHVGPTAGLLLCRLYRDQVMCVAEVRGARAVEHTSFERGRPMPLLRGAPSKAILANLPPRRAEQLWLGEAPRETDRDPDWARFRAHLAGIRKAGVVVSHGEVDPGVVGVAAPVFEQPGRRTIGAVAAVLPEETATPPVIARISILIRASADEITATLAEREERKPPPGPTETPSPKSPATSLQSEVVSARVARRS